MCVCVCAVDRGSWAVDREEREVVYSRQGREETRSNRTRQDRTGQDRIGRAGQKHTLMTTT